MIRSILRLLHREPPSPGRELARIQHEYLRKRRNAVAQKMRREMGLPPSEALR